MTEENEDREKENKRLKELGKGGGDRQREKAARERGESER